MEVSPTADNDVLPAHPSLPPTELTESTKQEEDQPEGDAKEHEHLEEADEKSDAEDAEPPENSPRKKKDKGKGKERKPGFFSSLKRAFTQKKVKPHEANEEPAPEPEPEPEPVVSNTPSTMLSKLLDKEKSAEMAAAAAAAEEKDHKSISPRDNSSTHSAQEEKSHRSFSSTERALEDIISPRPPVDGVRSISVSKETTHLVFRSSRLCLRLHISLHMIRIRFQPSPNQNN